MPQVTETIAAVATPAGRGGIGVVRVSGPGAAEVARGLGGSLPPPRMAVLRAFMDAGGRPIDEGLMLYFPAPRSYTGEDVLELHGHGGPVVMQMLLQRVLELGARPARPGEFSERAFLNGKLDLVQAEAVADLIDSSSARAARSALRSLQGNFSEALRSLMASLTETRALAEAWLDFADDELGRAPDAALESRLRRHLEAIDSVLRQARSGQALREGVRVVIAGPPNAGKSSLLNRLAGEQRAIVTDIPGTTRDTLEGSAVVDGIVFNLVDTAGLRDSADEIEQEGMRRARAAFGSADLILLLVEPSTPEDSVRTLLDEGGSAAVVLVRNKIDLIGGTPGRTALQGTRAELRLSVRTGEGIDLLLQVLRETAGAEALDDGVFLARSRHLAGLEQARDCLAQALRENRGAVIPLELLAENLRGAQNALGAICGEVTAEDVLDEIFSRFCIGK